MEAVDEWPLYEREVQSPYHCFVAKSVYGISNKEQVHLSVVFCKHSLNAERTRKDGMKNENLNVCEHPSPVPELSTTSLLNDLKYSPSGEYQGSDVLGFLYCGPELFGVGISPS